MTIDQLGNHGGNRNPFFRCHRKRLPLCVTLNRNVELFRLLECLWSCHYKAHIMRIHCATQEQIDGCAYLAYKTPMRPKTKDGQRTNLFLDRETKLRLHEIARLQKCSLSEVIEGLVNEEWKSQDGLNSVSPTRVADAAASAALKSAGAGLAPKPSTDAPSAPTSPPSVAGRKRRGVRRPPPVRARE